MAIEWDHLFICVSAGGPEGDLLTAFGSKEGTPNTHRGQGTACRRFFFENAYLELLWVQDPSEAQSDLTRATHLWDRWSNRRKGSCPFGFIFRPKADAPGPPPFPCWEYRPAWLPPGMKIAIGSNAAVLAEPMLVFLQAAPPTGDRSAAPRQLPVHTPSLQSLRRVVCVLPNTDRITPELESIVAAGLITIRSGPAFALELGFDDEAQGQTVDFRPGLPLVFRW